MRIAVVDHSFFLVVLLDLWQSKYQKTVQELQNVKNVVLQHRSELQCLIFYLLSYMVILKCFTTVAGHLGKNVNTFNTCS